MSRITMSFHEHYRLVYLKGQTCRRGSWGVKCLRFLPLDSWALSFLSVAFARHLTTPHEEDCRRGKTERTAKAHFDGPSEDVVHLPLS
jgi:hypothetical protein